MSDNQLMREATAVIPAAGLGTRLAGLLPGSKEAADIGGRPLILHLLDRLALAGIERSVVVTRADKIDLQETLAPVAGAELLIVDTSPSELHSVAAGAARSSGATALAYPDVLFEPRNAFATLLDQLEETETAEVVLGLFPTDEPERVDMVALDADGRPAEIVIKQPDRGLRYSWAIAAWKPRFTEFLIDHAAGIEVSVEPSVGEAVQAAIEAGLGVDAVPFESGRYIEVGTPEGLSEARRLAEP